MNTSDGALPDPFVAVVATAISALPAAHVEALAQAVGGYSAPTVAAITTVSSAVPTGPFHNQAGQVVRAWLERAPALSGEGLALALRSALAAAEQLRRSQSIDVVWTGPSSQAVPVRLTREILLDVVHGSTRSLVLVSFAAYRVPELVAAIQRATARGVAVDLILETSVDEGGTLSVAAADAFEGLHERVAVHVWPATARSIPGGGHAAMHAKAAIADDSVALVTSANLTGHGVDHNMELGLLVRGGDVPHRLGEHFRSLISAGILERTPG